VARCLAKKKKKPAKKYKKPAKKMKKAPWITRQRRQPMKKVLIAVAGTKRLTDR
jgi:hypothetical protein